MVFSIKKFNCNYPQKEIKINILISFLFYKDLFSTFITEFLADSILLKICQSSVFYLKKVFLILLFCLH